MKHNKDGGRGGWFGWGGRGGWFGWGVGVVEVYGVVGVYGLV